MNKSGMSASTASSTATASAPPAAPSAAATSQSLVQASSASQASGYRLPEMTTLQHAAKLSIIEDKPIMLDYWTSSLEKTVFIGVKENRKKLLVKSQVEYTSVMSNIYKTGTEYIIMTENCIYIVDVNIATKRIS